jgi:hypothetical protein
LGAGGALTLRRRGCGAQLELASDADALLRACRQHAATPVEPLRLPGAQKLFANNAQCAALAPRV